MAAARSGATFGVPSPREKRPALTRPQFQSRTAPLGTYSRSPP